MASAKQIAANRQNALKSTGPKSTENVRFNALRHGLRAQILILPDEDPALFNNLLQDLETEWQPQTPTEFIQVERMAVNYWKLARADRREAFFRLNDMPDRFVDQSFRFQQGFERAFDRAQCALERMQANRLPAQSPQPPADTAEDTAAAELPAGTVATIISAEPSTQAVSAETAEPPAEGAVAIQTAPPDLQSSAPNPRFSLAPGSLAPAPTVSLKLCNSRNPYSPLAST